MKSLTRLALALLAVGLVSTAAHAQLLLSGTVNGTFTDLGQPNTTVVNDPVGNTAMFSTGVPASATDTQTSITFTGSDFVNIGPGPVALGMFEIVNGITLAGTAAPTATFNLGLTLVSPEASSGLLTMVTFDIDNTLNDPATVPDIFGTSFASIPSMYVAGYKVDFSLIFAPDPLVVPEGSNAFTGDLYATFTPVPEPGSFALVGVGMLAGCAALRRRRPQPASLTCAA